MPGTSLRAEGLALSWIATGRLIFSLNCTEADFEAVADRFVAAARAMQADGWRRHAPEASNKAIRRRILREMLAHRLSGRRAPATEARAVATDRGVEGLSRCARAPPRAIGAQPGTGVPGRLPAKTGAPV